LTPGRLGLHEVPLALLALLGETVPLEVVADAVEVVGLHVADLVGDVGHGGPQLGLQPGDELGPSGWAIAAAEGGPAGAQAGGVRLIDDFGVLDGATSDAQGATSQYRRSR
jgi:hypothetical protein